MDGLGGGALTDTKKLAIAGVISMHYMALS